MAALYIYAVTTVRRLYRSYRSGDLPACSPKPIHLQAETSCTLIPQALVHLLCLPIQITKQKGYTITPQLDGAHKDTLNGG